MFATLAYRLLQWQREREAIRRLEQLDDRLLADMGAERAQIGDFVRRRVRRKG